MTNRNALADTKLWMATAIPEPKNKNVHTQMGVHFEEVAEMIDTIQGLDFETTQILARARVAIRTLSDHLKASDNIVRVNLEDRVDYLDALCDQIVTAVGCAHNSGLDIVGAMDEVNRSNFSKFDDRGYPIFDGNRKIIKGPNYTRAELKPFTQS